MPYDEVLSKYKAGTLHSGSQSGPKVTSRSQAIAIMLSEKRNVKTHPEYAAKMKRRPGPKKDGYARKQRR